MGVIKDEELGGYTSSAQHKHIKEQAKNIVLQACRGFKAAQTPATLANRYVLSRPIVGSDESCDRAVKLVDS